MTLDQHTQILATQGEKAGFVTITRSGNDDSVVVPFDPDNNAHGWAKFYAEFNGDGTVVYGTDGWNHAYSTTNPEVALAPLALAEYIKPTAPPSEAEIARRRRVARKARAKR